MINKKKLQIILFAVCSYLPYYSLADIKILNSKSPNTIPIISNGYIADILLDKNDDKVVKIAAEILSNDIKEVTGKRAKVYFSTKDLKSNIVIIAGTLGKSAKIDSLIKSGKIDISEIKGKWEASIITTLKDVSPNIKQAVIIVGSDRRGTAYGLMDLSQAIGVSPWIWWADVKPKKREELHLIQGVHIETGPSVKYRGFFINDEDWSLIPWIKNTFDPELGNIGPKTYKRIFSLMLRLKANYLWPAMHGCSNHFNKFPENAQLADDYGIVMGASHCEPMLRNNVKEWYPWKTPNGDKKGRWNYFSNPKQIYQYWDQRVVANGKFENVYTVGMRGIHDGSMPGGRNNKERARKLEQVFADQREILAKRTKQKFEDIPQIFCPYKEVMYVYDAGLKVPDDVTICWAEDNQGYMRRLPDKNERKRSGRHGLYFHLSYWSDYLWLSSFSPQLLSYELTKAAEYTADKLWVFNVGDIKICEKEIDFAMNLAWDLKAWGADTVDKWAEDWARKTFNKDKSKEIGHILNEYYRLAFRGKPEHIGHVKYSISEIKQRLLDYDKIAKSCEDLRKTMPTRLQDAFIHLIYYPVVACKYHNDKILLARLSLLYANSGNETKALSLATQAHKAWGKVKLLTNEYNSTANGKWEHLMSWHPRNLKVFQMPPVASKSDFNNIETINLDLKQADLTKPMAIKNDILYGTSAKTEKHNTGGKAVLKFSINKDDFYYIYAEAQTPSVNEDSFFLIFDDKEQIIMNEQVTGSDWRWLKIGKVKLNQGKHTLTICQREPNAKIKNILITSKNMTFTAFSSEPVKILTTNDINKKSNGSSGRKLKFAKGLSIDGNAVYTLPHLGKSIPEDQVDSAPFIEFKTTLKKGKHRLRIKCLPSHPPTKNQQLRYAISINGKESTIHNVKYKETFHNHHSCSWTLKLLTEPDLIGYVYKDHNLDLLKKQEVTIRISLLDPSLIFYRIECF